MDEIIKHIMELLGKTVSNKEEHIHFPNKSYKAVKIDKSNFHDIKEANSDKKVVFIDGGNAEIIKTASFSLQLVRVYYAVYDNNKKIKSKKEQFFVLINAVNGDGKINYKIKIFDDALGLNKEKLVFDSFDSTIKTGIHRIRVSRMGDIVRRFAELKIAASVIDELSNGDVIVMDGDLQASVTNEGKFFDSLYKKALEKGVITAGLSKTSNLLTNNGNCVNALLNEISPGGSWYYHPIVKIENESHKAEVFFIKLHEKSKHVFKFEIFKENKFDINEVLTLLLSNSRDPIFLGYPYGLIDADRFARISNSEREYLKTIFMSKAGKNWQKISNYITPTNAHEILDSIS